MFLDSFGHFPFFSFIEILQFNIMNCSRITCVVKFLIPIIFSLSWNKIYLYLNTQHIHFYN